MDEKRQNLRKQIKKWVMVGRRNAILAMACLVILTSGSAYALSHTSFAEHFSHAHAHYGGDNNVDVDPVDNYFLVDKSEYAGVLLDKTEDAGENYLKDTLFIGDSNTARLYMYGFLPLDNVIGIESMSIHGALNNKAVYFKGYNSPVTIAEAVGIMKPRRVVISFGTNDLATADTQAFINTYRQFIKAIQTAYPYTDIIIAAVPPFAKSLEGQRLSINTVESYNIALIGLAKEMGLVFADTGEALTGTDRFIKPSYIIEDGIHISEDGFEALLKYIRTHSHITEDTRPKPLGTIPKQVLPPRPDPVEEEQFNCDAAASAAYSALISYGFSAPPSSVDWSGATVINWSVSFAQAVPGTEAEIGANISNFVKSQTTLSSGYLSISYSINESAQIYGFTIRILPLCGSTHTYGAWAVTKAPTCGAAGTETRVCTVCGNPETRPISATGQHVWGAPYDIVNPTCGVAGSQNKKCTVCNTVTTETLPATGQHTWSGGICTVCGASEPLSGDPFGGSYKKKREE